ncbi:MAG: hypothetical protein H6811_11925 [Phycisphaeraceae bacterium]|nr:hypothetical protein [Phycisphaeraceae bacterium]
MSTTAGFLLALSAMGQVHLRGIDSPLPGDVINVTLDGVEVGSPTSGIVSWDRIREVDGSKADEAAVFQQYGDDAWRARTRLLRGDAIGAEPLFERLFVVYGGREGPTAAVVADGLLRCRLRRGAHTAAVGTWLSLLHAGPDIDTGFGAVPIIDEATGLVPALPPIWLSGPAVEALARGIEQTSFDADPRARSLAQWYRAAAAFECGQAPQLPQLLPEDPGQSLVADIVLSRVGEPGARASARDRLSRRADAAIGTWIEAWCRAALGRSLLRESDPESRRLGIVWLLHVPARFAQDHPSLAAISLAEAASALWSLGDSSAAQRVLQELLDHYRGHPASGWAGLRQIPLPTPSRPTAQDISTAGGAQSNPRGAA